MTQKTTFKKGDHVLITKKGLARHLKHHNTNSRLIAFISDRISFGKELKDASHELWSESNQKSLEASIGVIEEVRQRWFWQPGHDYLVIWGEENEDSWHLSKHLKLASKQVNQ